MSNPKGAPGLKLIVRIGKKQKTFKSIEDAAKAFKIPYQTLYQRLFYMGWSHKDALITPVRKRKKVGKKRK
jgi:hypothetical protein